jgi:hypothetical protein
MQLTETRQQVVARILRALESIAASLEVLAAEARSEQDTTRLI